MVTAIDTHDVGPVEGALDIFPYSLFQIALPLFILQFFNWTIVLTPGVTDSQTPRHPPMAMNVLSSRRDLTAKSMQFALVW
jgi:hypothetical protein